MLLTDSLHPFLMDQNADLETRLWVNERYGNIVTSLWTIFEVTLSGCWPNHARTLVYDVSVWYAPCYACYILLVVFGIIRVITALFLKETLQAAASDADVMIQVHKKEREKYASKLRNLFMAADTSGDGAVSYEEFTCVLNIPEAKSYLATLELAAHDVDNLFNLLDDGDGQISLDEFINGCIRLKGTAKSQDLIAVLHAVEKLSKTMKRSQATEENRVETEDTSQNAADDILTL
jgi:hypothetical protein